MTVCNRIRAAFGAGLLLCFVGAALAAEPPPDWAFPVNPPSKTSATPPADNIEHVPGSKLTFTDRQINDEFFVADWFPDEHGPMPAAVSIGRKPAVMPCAVCHLPTGNGGPAEAALPGLPANYILEQINEFRAGRRKVAQRQMESARSMEELAKAVSNAEAEAAARYFSQLKFSSHFHVVETDTAPKTRVAEVSLHVKIGGGEPLGQRIVEVPDDAKQWEIGNPHTEFTAYVPKDSIARGAALVSSGDGALPCRSCHGPELKGMGNVPPTRRPFTQLPRPPALRHPARNAHRPRRRTDAAASGAYDAGGSHCDRGVSGVVTQLAVLIKLPDKRIRFLSKQRMHAHPGDGAPEKHPYHQPCGKPPCRCGFDVHFLAPLNACLHRTQRGAQSWRGVCAGGKFNLRIAEKLTRFVQTKSRPGSGAAFALGRCAGYQRRRARHGRARQPGRQ